MPRWTWDMLMLALCAAWLVALAAVVTGPSGGMVAFLIHPATAGWAQAIFTAVAIIGSALIVRWQVAKSHAQELARAAAKGVSERRALQLRAYGLAALAISRMRRTAELLRSDRANAHFRNIALAIRVDRNAVVAFPIWQLPNGATMVTFSTFPGMLDLAVSTVEELRDSTGRRRIVQEAEIVEALGIFDELVRTAEKRIGELVKQLDDYVGTAARAPVELG